MTQKEIEQTVGTISAQIGKLAPDFTLTTHTGEQVTLSHFRQHKNVILYFYPKDNTPSCTTEACTFRDNYQLFTREETEVIGISSDSPLSHQKFSRRHQLPFTLLTDPHGTIRKRYQITATFGLIPGRVTYLIDKQGIIRHIFSDQFHAQRHITEALNALKSLQQTVE